MNEYGFYFFCEYRQDYLDIVLNKFSGVNQRDRRRFLLKKLSEWHEESLFK